MRASEESLYTLAHGTCTYSPNNLILPDTFSVFLQGNLKAATLKVCFPFLHYLLKAENQQFAFLILHY